MVLIGQNFMHTPVSAIAWILAALISILAHEMGHALAMRAYGYWPAITLYGFGGVTTCDSNTYGATRTTTSKIVTTAAGPGVGFTIFGIILFVKILLLPPGTITLSGIINSKLAVLFTPVAYTKAPFLNALIELLFIVNLFWSFLNIMPVLPLDGGQILRDILVKFFGHKGLHATLIISVAAAAIIAFFAFHQWRAFFMMILFIMLAVQNFMALQAYERGQRY